MPTLKFQLPPPETVGISSEGGGGTAQEEVMGDSTVSSQAALESGRLGLMRSLCPPRSGLLVYILTPPVGVAAGLSHELQKTATISMRGSYEKEGVGQVVVGL